MASIFKELVFTDDSTDNWFFKDFYFSGSNHRYWTFQVALNLLAQRTQHSVIIETGCQRQADDLGAGMSTSIFGAYCLRYGGKLYAVDIVPRHLEICKECTRPYASQIEYVLSDSVEWLRKSKGIVADLLYLDSLDYPISADGTQSIDPVGEKAAQEHCLNEFLAAQKSGKITSKTIVLVDDNQLPGGGKPRLLKEHLGAAGWICLIDFQQSLWVREL